MTVTEMTPDQKLVLDLVLNGEWSMAQGLMWARKNGFYAFADYLRTF